MKIYLELCQLQSETKGAHFTLSYSTVNKIHTVYFPNKQKRFESPDPATAITEAMAWIKDNRKEATKFKL